MPTIKGKLYTSQILWLETTESVHWLFSRGSKERLGDRVSVLPLGGEHFEIRPLAGENLVVYRNPIARELGIYEVYATPFHPDPAVFVSVGPFSLAFRPGERRGNKPARDRIVVFFDRSLPILLPMGEQDRYEASVPRWGIH